MTTTDSNTPAISRVVDLPRSCSYIPNSNQPCETCPRLITMLYMCGFLQEGVVDDEPNDQRQATASTQP